MNQKLLPWIRELVFKQSLETASNYIQKEEEKAGAKESVYSID